ncbi:Methyltransferase domain-containing protein [Formivibrio citricus]|uniref:Methyltransferase domain-containing protein n=1 Tax=Formivibrio citricus TaxID=83765 RepID=A0A1I5D1D0_9NEIS|nr:class I SAM-dependent methyltransferase [Formivibrio citricus]SFN93034.1 Methyltransferase domain-containing protein [Formivibrio citricus]
MASPDNSTPFEASQYTQAIRTTLPYYDALYAEVIGVVKAIKPQARTWLDTGCGDGILVEKALPDFPATLFLMADPSEGMLARARSRLGQYPHDRVSVLGAQGTENLSLDDRPKPEVITAILSHHYFDCDQRRLATKRCFDLLPEGGLYITIENIRPDTEAGTEIALQRWAAWQLAQGRSPEDVRTHIGRFDKGYHPIRRDEHLALLTECGFGVAEQFWLSYLQGGFYAIK